MKLTIDNTEKTLEVSVKNPLNEYSIVFKRNLNIGSTVHNPATGMYILIDNGEIDMYIKEDELLAVVSAYLQMLRI